MQFARRVAALEDKIVQRALVEVLNAIWEEDFLGFSYGFRPGRGQHDALDALAVGIGQRKVNWILDADIAGFFDTVSHEWLSRFIEHRIGDQRVIRLIRKWLKAGVAEDGQVTPGEVGTPQGAVISPLLANIYLHYVFDLWATQWRQRHAQGDVIMVRYADDIVAGFEHQADAERFWADMRARLAEFALTLHRGRRGSSRLDTTRRRTGGLAVSANRRRSTFSASPTSAGTSTGGEASNSSGEVSQRPGACQAAGDQRRRCVEAMHETVDEQGAWLLSRVVMGFNAYHAVPTNAAALEGTSRHNVANLWRRILRRRGQKGASDVGADDRASKSMASKTAYHPSLARETLRRQTPKGWEPGAGNTARRDLCGGAR